MMHESRCSPCVRRAEGASHSQLSYREPVSIRRILFIPVVALVAVSCSDRPTPDAKREPPAEPRPAESEMPSGNTQHAEEASPSPAAEPDRGAADAEGETDLQPHEDKIAEDCVAFVRATKAVSPPSSTAECPTCPTDGAEVLRFQSMKMEGIFCSAEACEATVAICVSFNAGSGESIGGGLTAWIAPEQRAEYLRGNTPAGEQVYRVKITYKRAGEAWRAVEFDRMDPEPLSGSPNETE